MRRENQSLEFYIKKAALWWSIGAVASLILVFLLTIKTNFAFFDYTKTGEIGDTIGGISSPFIGIAAAVLTFLAFYMQFKANEMHSSQFMIQKKENERNKHESTIVFLMKQNRSIVDSMSVGGKKQGATCFVLMLLELQAIFVITKDFYTNKLTDDELANISYLLLFNGVGSKSDELNMPLLQHIPKHQELLWLLRGIVVVDDKVYGIENLESKIYIRNLLYNMQYKPFDGHQSRLGHYFRNLFHMLKYTTSVDDELISPDDKYEIIKSLRSQLTSHEQIFIYFNAISSYGAPMREAKYIETYQLIKNIPLPMVSFAGDIRERFPDVQFEWDEIISRAESNSAHS